MSQDGSEAEHGDKLFDKDDLGVSNAYFDRRTIPTAVMKPRRRGRERTTSRNPSLSIPSARVMIPICMFRQFPEAKGEDLPGMS